MTRSSPPASPCILSRPPSLPIAFDACLLMTSPLFSLLFHLMSFPFPLSAVLLLTLRQSLHLLLTRWYTAPPPPPLLLQRPLSPRSLQVILQTIGLMANGTRFVLHAPCSKDIVLRLLCCKVSSSFLCAASLAVAVVMAAEACRWARHRK